MTTVETFKVVMLTAEKASETLKNLIHKIEKENKLILVEENNNELTIPQHLYIISDEEIKEGDKVIHKDSILTVSKNRGLYLSVEELTHVDVRADICKKIAATTDKDLGCFKKAMSSHVGVDEDVFQNLPKLQEAFIQAYIKAYNEGKPITEVDLEVECYSNNVMIDADAPPIVKIKTRPDNTVIVHQSKMYTRDEVIELCKKAYSKGHYNGLGLDSFNNPILNDKWIKDNL